MAEKWVPYFEEGDWFYSYDEESIKENKDLKAGVEQLVASNKHLEKQWKW